MNRDALVVGINQYPFLKDTLTSKAKHLKTPANDAEAIAQRLEEYGGFRVRRLPETIQEGQRRVAGATGALVQADALEDAIIQLFNPVGESVSQTALLYFIGHGLRKNRGGVTEGFLATSDADPRKNQWGVSLRWLRELLQKSPVQQQIVWLDCCYSGELFNFAEADLGTAERERTRFFIAAAREFEPAEEDIEGQHGVFSLALWEGLDPRRQPEGVVNNDKLIEYIAQTLKDVPQQPIWYNPNSEIILTGEREQIFISTPDGNCPYKGLRFFDVEDADYFYGREALTQKLIERVQVGKGNFLAVLGVSGSGKSSLLRAGLMYQLQQERRLAGTEQWKIRIFTPGEQPLVSLATVFLDEEVTDIERAGYLKEAEDAIAAGATGWARLIRASKSPRTVLIVDQFEEVFTLCQSQTDRQQFISYLLGALKQTGDKLCLIFAMRDDFLGKCAAYRELAELIQANLLMVTPMNAQELRQAIVEPAKKLGRKVEENLIDVILKDLGVEIEEDAREPEPGMLPLLSYTLEQLWQRQTLNWLKLDSYNRLGGVQKTLENLAEQTYKQLSGEEQRVADQVFIKLTQLGEGTPDTRKQVPQQDLITQSQSANLVERVIQKLAQAKLIVTSEQRKGQEKVAVVDVAHEALIRYWSRLQELLDNNREAIRTERKIQASAEEWQDKEKSKDYLLTGLRLGEAEKFLQDEVDIVPLSSLAGEFIEESRKERDRLLVKEERRRQRELEQERNIRKVAQARNKILATSVVLIGTAAFIAFWQLHESVQSQIDNLAALSETTFLTNDELGAIIASVKGSKQLKQISLIKSSIRIRAIAILQKVVYGSQEHNRLDGYIGLVYSVSFSSDSQTIASAGEDGIIRLWNRDGKLLQFWKAHDMTINSVKFSPDNQTIVSASSDRTVKLWSRDGNLLEIFRGHSDSVSNASFSPDGKIIASTGEDQTIRIWNIEKRLLKIIQTHSNRVRSLSFSPDGQTIVSASDDKTVKLWSIDGTLVKTFRGHNDSVLDVNFSPDGKMIASASRDQSVKLWSLDGRELKTLLGHSHFVLSVAFSPDSQMLVSSSVDNTVKLWNLDGTEQKTFRGHTSRVSSVSFSPNGQTIVSASDDGTIRLWNKDSTSLKILQDHRDRVWSVTFSPDGQIIASASNDETVKLWSKEGILLKTLRGHTDRVRSVTFSPDGQIIASASNDKTVKLWSREGILLKTFSRHNSGVLDVSFSPDRKMIASSDNNGAVKLWSLDGREIYTFKGSSFGTFNVSFSPDGKIIASGSGDNTVKLWSLEGRELHTFKDNKFGALDVSFSPDGKTLASAGGDNIVILWNLDLDNLLIRACNHLHDYLKTNPNIESDRHLCDGIGTNN